jgi:adenine-specific DNA-methyltransferase
MTDAYEKVKQLVKHFKEQEAAYLSPGYQESQVRQDFIDKFFTALAWDVTHEVQKNPYEQEVKIENKVNTSGSQRRADYAFFISPNYRDVKFFVEAKKPSRSLSNPNDYYQAIRYGWNSKTPIAVLTDFEEFHILDCRFKPDIKTALDRKLEVFHYSDYEDEEKFKKIFYLLSHDEVSNGSIEKYSSTLPKPRGKGVKQGMFKTEYKAVDEAFLEALDGYREQLAHVFKNKNQKLEGEELTEAVQRTIDRLVFIRFLEDKSIEEPSIVAIKDKPAVWKALISLCKRLEPKYNGLVFKPHRIIDSPDFIPPDDKMFAAICDELANPTSPYDFDKIPISILGSIYERFLGKVVSTTDKRAKIIEKPEVRKAGGVYYTPEYIVRYIVTETVGKVIEDKTPKEISQMAFADIACGSGSFLIEVYNQLLDYHTKYYNEFPEKAKKGDVETREGKTVLSLKKRQEILVNNIYGVDIDFQATEVTQLSLYLKLLEDVTMNDAFQYSLLKEKILPDLKNNIVCGNSLIGRDILDAKLFDDETEHTLKPMNFEDVFPDIMNPSTRSGGGFDVVVGNPPYRMLQPHNTTTKLLNYLKEHFFAADFKIDLFHLFMQKGISILRAKGMLGYIVPTTVLNNVYVESLRTWVMDNACINSIAVCPEHVFETADVHTSILVFTRESNAKERSSNMIRISTSPVNSLTDDKNIYSYTHQQRFSDLPGKVWNVLLNETNGQLIKQLTENYKKLEDITAINRGLITGDRGKFFASTKESKGHVPIIAGGDVERYYTKPSSEFVLFERPKTAGGCWDKEVHFAPHKLVIRQIGFTPTASVLTTPIAVTGNIFTIIAEDLKNELYILGIINSKLIKYYWEIMFTDFKTSFPQVTIFSLSQLPICIINFDDPADKARHDNIVKLVEQMLDAKKKLANAKTESETNRFEMLCKTLDRQIDEAVYELYGLTEEEIKIVEGK